MQPPPQCQRAGKQSPGAWARRSAEGAGIGPIAPLGLQEVAVAVGQSDVATVCANVAEHGRTLVPDLVFAPVGVIVKPGVCYPWQWIRYRLELLVRDETQCDVGLCIAGR